MAISDIRVIDIQEVDATDDREPVYLGGRGAGPPESCRGPRGYRLMLKLQQQGASVSDPALVEATIQLLSAAHPEQPANIWSWLRDAVREGWQTVDRRFLEHGPLEPDRFSLQEANERLATLSHHRGRIRP